MYGLNDRADAVDRAVGAAEDAPRFQLGKGSFTRCVEAGVGPVVALVRGGQVAVSAVECADCGAGRRLGK